MCGRASTSLSRFSPPRLLAPSFFNPVYRILLQKKNHFTARGVDRALGHRLQNRLFFFRLPPAVLTISSGRVELRNSKKKEKQISAYAATLSVWKDAPQASGKFLACEGFPSFLTPPAQPKRAISTAIRQGLNTSVARIIRSWFRFRTVPGAWHFFGVARCTAFR